MRSGTDVPVRLLEKRTLEVCPMLRAKGNKGVRAHYGTIML